MSGIEMLLTAIATLALGLLFLIAVILIEIRDELIRHRPKQLMVSPSMLPVGMGMPGPQPPNEVS